MITPERIRPEDKVRIEISFGDREACGLEASGFHNISEAVDAAYDRKCRTMPREACVFTVSNLTTGVKERYRFNAHGHLKLIV